MLEYITLSKHSNRYLFNQNHMNTGRYVEIKLDPFFQSFLRSHFKEYEQIFEFPKGHDLLIRLEYLLAKPPADYKPKPESGDSSMFRIAIPYMEHKNIDSYTYMSLNAQRLFVSRIREYYKIIIHEEISSARRKGFQKDEIVLKIMEDFNLTNFNDDRIKRDYTRYLNTERFRRYRIDNKKNQKKLVS